MNLIETIKNAGLFKAQMKISGKSLLALGFLSLTLASCGGLSQSEYTPGKAMPDKVGSEDEGTQESAESNREIPKRPPALGGENSEPSFYSFFAQVEGSEKQVEQSLDIDFGEAVTTEVGVDQCVANELGALGVAPHKPKTDMTQPIQSYVDALDGSLGSYYDLLDSFFYNTVTNDGRVDYSQIRPGAPLADVWKAIVDASKVLMVSKTATEAEKVAFWVNTYNVKMIGFFKNNEDPVNSTNFANFDAPRTVGGFKLSLNQIEYRILKLSNRPDIPNPTDVAGEELLPDLKHTQLHMALVCGAVSCPKLRRFAYRAESLNQVLEENLYMFFNDRTKHFKKESGSYKVSGLIGFFPKDFDIMAGSDKSFLAKRFTFKGCQNNSDQEVLDFVKAFEGISSFSKLPLLTYDWSPNAL